MKRTSTQGARRMQVPSIVGLAAFFLLIALNFIPFTSVKQVHAEALQPVTTLPPLGVIITSPANNAVFGQYSQIPIAASVTPSIPNSITKVRLYATLSGGTATLIGTATTAPYHITWAVRQAGSYTLMARTYDTYGHVATSPPVSIFVPVRDPLEFHVTFTSPANGAGYPIIMQVPLAVSFSIDPTTVREVDYYYTLAGTGGTGTPIPTSTPTAPTLIGIVTTAPFSLNWTPPQPGTYTLTARAYDIYPGDFGISTPVTVTVLSEATPTPTLPPNYCKVSYTLSSQWPGGFSANITITNTGSAINGWILTFTFPGDQKITNLWNGTVSQSGEQVIITNASWNGSIPSQGTVSLGFNGSWTGINNSPGSFVLNGHVCS